MCPSGVFPFLYQTAGAADDKPEIFLARTDAIGDENERLGAKGLGAARPRPPVSQSPTIMVAGSPSFLTVGRRHDDPRVQPIREAAPSNVKKAAW